MNVLVWTIVHLAWDRVSEIVLLPHFPHVCRTRRFKFGLGQSAVTLYAVPTLLWLVSKALRSSPVSSPHDRMYAHSEWHLRVCQWLMSITLYELALYSIDGKPFIFWVHHIFMLTGVFLYAHARVALCYAVIFTTIEVTGLFTTILQLCRRETSWTFLMASTSLWWTFLTCRVVGIPALWLLWIHDCAQLGAFRWDVLTCATTGVPLILWGMSVHWFLKIHAAFLTRIVGGSAFAR